MKRLVFPTLLVTMVLCDPCFAGTKVLLPIFLDQPVHGALGSVWTSPFSLHNSGSDAALILVCSSDGTFACPGVIEPGEEIEPGQTQHILPPVSTPSRPVAPARVVTFEPPDTDPLVFNL